MFSGIVETTGTVAEVREAEDGRGLRLKAPDIAGALSEGASVSVDGACLTVVAVHPDGFSVDVIGPTLSRTIARTYVEGSKVNLERALRVGDRLDGHLVQGHVDAVGEVTTVQRSGETCFLDLVLPEVVDAVTVLHGSIAVNGVSLTVGELPEPGRCRVALIPLTQSRTTLSRLRPGDPVNLEGDLIGKYVGRMLAARAGALPSSSGPNP